MATNRIGNLKKYYPNMVFVPNDPNAIFNTIYQVTCKDPQWKETEVIYFCRATLSAEERVELGKIARDRKYASCCLNNENLKDFALFMIKDFPLISSEK